MPYNDQLKAITDGVANARGLANLYGVAITIGGELSLRERLGFGDSPTVDASSRTNYTAQARSQARFFRETVSPSVDERGNENETNGIEMQEITPKVGMPPVL